MTTTIDIWSPTTSGETFDKAALIERALALAGMGAWSCDLADSSLLWTAGIYDLFGLPADTRVDRRETVAMYAEESREAMERARAQAIADAGTSGDAKRGRFSVDAEIVRTDGARRWMRLTGNVVVEGGRARRLYGLKQDITDEKLRWEAMRQLAEHDALTGLASRAVFQNRFLDAPAGGSGLAPLGALILFDVDGFKQVNDRLGHAAGDACLRVVAERLAAGFPDAPMIARIGGDEFAVLVGAETLGAALELRLAAALADLRMPIVWAGEILRVGASAGIAMAGDGYAYDAEAMFAVADAALYAAKTAGRNTFRVGMPGGEVEQVMRLVG
ncbi:GGDEF domain-containing protein [Sphingomonas albertensis]|uniref:GGDEF domain-containing protein n=1 Tax=Sphingomonas albertensis TaxID=2762591 RepID=A0ABR7AND0_9SPHN|nr:GGDEF domain-containing protein [Sphingomonas albertensis]MBC3941822.1 GGDEF domain-containing protein [Sphingomonas albertensis]